MLKLLRIFIIVSLLFPVQVFSHSGRTDAKGGHNNRKTGGYHYHNSGRQSTQKTSVNTSKESKSVSHREYYLNTKTNIRHNKGCRWYSNTKKGRKCEPDEGQACRVCGG